MVKLPVICVKQPIGEFYVSAIRADILLNIVTINQRTLEKDDGVQRELSKRRVDEIALYTTDPDATFPTPIIIACDESRVQLEGNFITFPNDQVIGEVIDGQHRVQGLRKAGKDSVTAFELPVVFMLGLEEYEKAYVFSTINSKQTPVPRSLIYQLFSLSEHRSPIKTCHEIARALNAKENSPFYQGLKMLGKRNLPTEYLTQGSFVTNLVKRISKQPQADEISVKRRLQLQDDDSLPFRYYWINGQDEVIVRILENYFGAIQEIFPREWNFPTADEFILRKTVGFQALLGAFDIIWRRSVKDRKATKEFFADFARAFRQNLGDRNLTTAEFGSSAQQATALRDALIGNLGSEGELAHSSTLSLHKS